MSQQKISPGIHAPINYPFEGLASRFGIPAKDFTSVDSLKTTVYVGPESVIKIFPEGVSQGRAEIAVALSQLAGRKLAMTHPDISVPRYLETENGDHAVHHYRHTAVAMERLPGEQPHQLPNVSYLARLATAHAVIHSVSRTEPLFARAIGNVPRLNRTDDYISTYMRRDWNITVPDEVLPAIGRLDRHWGSFYTGVVPMDLRSGNTLADENGNLAAIIDWEDAAIAPRIACLGMALWGIYAQSGGNADLVHTYVNAYREHAQPALSQLEEIFYPDAMTARGVTSWYGAKLIGAEEAANNDMGLIRQWVAGDPYC